MVTTLKNSRVTKKTRLWPSQMQTSAKAGNYGVPGLCVFVCEQATSGFVLVHVRCCDWAKGRKWQFVVVFFSNCCSNLIIHPLTLYPVSGVAKFGEFSKLEKKKRSNVLASSCLWRLPVEVYWTTKPKTMRIKHIMNQTTLTLPEKSHPAFG